MFFHAVSLTSAIGVGYSTIIKDPKLSAIQRERLVIAKDELRELKVTATVASVSIGIYCTYRKGA